MSISKIKLKQIDADFPSLVGDYGSGFFASNESLNSVSGSSVKYSDLNNYQFVTQSGSQSISGYKNFLSRPALSGDGLAKLNEVVSLSSSQIVSGEKAFVGGVVFSENQIDYQFSTVAFIDTDFLLDSNSASNLSLSLGSNLVNTSSNQTIGGIKNFTSPIKIGGSGVLSSGTPFPLHVSYSGDNQERHLTFVHNGTDGFKNVQVNTGLSYNPWTKVLTCQNFSGSLQGHASNATVADTAIIANTATRLSGKNPIAKINDLPFDGASDILIRPYAAEDSADVQRSLLFASGVGNGYKNVFFDSAITANPSNNSISASTFIGGFSGSSLNATSAAGISFGTLNSTDNINFQFPKNTTAYQLSNTFFAPVADNVKALGQATRRWSVVYAGTSTINTSDFNLKTEISQIPDAWLDAWEQVEYVKYKFKDAVTTKGSSSARWHVGVIAQQINEVFESRGLDAFEMGLLCYDRWDEHQNENGETVPSGEIWSVRSDECQFLEMALMRRSINRLKSGVLI